MISNVNFGQNPSQPLRFGCAADPKPQFKGLSELGAAAIQKAQDGFQAAQTRLQGGQKSNYLA